MLGNKFKEPKGGQEGWGIMGTEGRGRKAGAKSCVALQVMIRSLDFTEDNAMSVGCGCVRNTRNRTFTILTIFKFTVHWH